MSDLRAALEFLTDGPLLNRIDRHNADRFAESVAVVAAAASRVVEAEEIWWCQTHDAQGLHFCWRAAFTIPLVIGDDPKARCQMVRRPLLKPVETRRDADPSGASPVS